MSKLLSFFPRIVTHIPKIIQFGGYVVAFINALEVFCEDCKNLKNKPLKSTE